ncbi:hypothetical protein [Actinomadura sp. WAC 06369]|uniref:hypothetical protein n=1 Tax=Actinomadura sp. WAC 06369 TaxID=2203193 RepID=UPI000F7AEFCF|nr:hypothetical protein [Actinomadura sp. WAC 06369]RSN62276.1 hypothetical protein DMH08_19390 [Actinomadura sp. WAC 06369]
MKFVMLQVAGMLLLVLGAQGAIRLIADHDAAGLLGGMPGGFPAALVVHLAGTLAGILLAGWANGRAKAGGRG